MKAASEKMVINCEPTLDISASEALYEHLGEAFQENHEIEIKAGEVTRVDTAILQVFTALMIEARVKDINVEWSSVSNTFYASAKLLGLTAELKLPDQISA